MLPLLMLLTAAPPADTFVPATAMHADGFALAESPFACGRTYVVAESRPG